MRRPAGRRSAVVVGAGLGGLGTAALLARSGFSVTVVERDSEPGGRSRTTSLDVLLGEAGSALRRSCALHLLPPEVRGDTPSWADWRSDPGPHVLPQIGGGALAALLRRSGGRLSGGRIRSLSVSGEEGRPIDARAMLFRDPATIAELPIFALRLAALTLRRSAARDDVPLERWIAESVRSPALRTYLSLMARTGASWGYTSELSTGEFLRCQRSLLLGRLALAAPSAGGYPEGGMSAIVGSLVRSIQASGGAVKCGVSVRQLEARAGSVAAAVTDTGERLVADAFVWGGGYRTLLAAARELPVPPDFRNRLTGLAPSSALVGISGLRGRPLPGRAFHFLDGVAGGRLVGLFAPSEFDPTLVPKEHQLVHFGSPVRTDELRSTAARTAALAAIWSAIDRRFPELAGATAFRISGWSANINGVAQIVGQTGKARPPIRAPFARNLYVVGDSVEGWGYGVEAAARSALRAHELIVSSG